MLYYYASGRRCFHTHPCSSCLAPNRPDYFGAPLLAAIKAGRVSEATITEKAVRVVYSLAVVGALDTPNTNSSDTDVTSPAHYVHHPSDATLQLALPCFIIERV